MIYSKNEILEVEITDMTNEGEGVGKATDGFTFFIKDCVIGDKARVRITKMKKNYGYARLEELISPSVDRQVPRCCVSRACGGCQIQALSYEKQLIFKENKVKNNLVRLGGFDEETINRITEDIISGPEYEYRNKAQFPFGTDKEGNPICGFYAGRTHSIISNTDCALGVPENKDILEIILNWMKKNRINSYDEVTQTGLVRHVLIRKGYYSGEIMVCLVINADKLPKQDALIEALKKVKGMTSISYSPNRKNTNVILGDTYQTVWGKDTIEDSLLGLKYSISPLSFYQVNPIQVEKLYQTAIDFANLNGDEEVWDLCCGIGTITLSMATEASFVHGIEIVPQAIEDAKKNAINNNIDNVEFICAAVEEYLPSQRNFSADVVVMDPPRKGMDVAALDAILKAAPRKMVYVSCDSATLARDLKYICANGYNLERVRPVDMFAQTSHVETVVLLSQLRQKPDDYIDVDIDVAELEGTSAETKATYEKIKKYVAEHNEGMKVSNLYIAQVKRKCGLELAENFNLPKSEDAKQPQCPKEKGEAIMEALKVFQMI